MFTKAALGLGFLTATTGFAVTAVLATFAVRPFDVDDSVLPPARTAMVASQTPQPERTTPPAEAVSATFSMTHTLERGDTLGGLLQKIGIAADEARAVVQALRRQFDPRRMRAGQDLNITLARPTLGMDAQAMQQLAFDVEFPYRIVVSRSPDGTFEASRDARPVRREVAEASGIIDSSLFEAGTEAGISPAILAEMIKMFSWDVDFQRDIHPGDRFSVVYDSFVDEAGETVKSGAVSAAALALGGRRRTIYRFVGADGHADFFTADGRTARKALLRTPIDGARLSSRFGMRRHPILGYSKMHKGVDFAAPRGTPIFAAGDGTVDYVGRRGGYGNYIRVRHRSGYSTAYAHLSKYARGLKKGRTVKQGQVIGYVGTTGRSTGPHLHYEVLKANRQINPLKVKSLPGRKLAGAELKQFRAFVARTDTRLATLLARATPTLVATADGP